MGTISKTAGVYCRVFKDNSGALTIETLQKIRPQFKNINNKYCHISEDVEEGKITIHVVFTQNHIADLLTKPLVKAKFTAMKCKIMVDHSKSKLQIC